MIYQTEHDKTKERAIVTAIAARWKCEASELPAYAALDWYLSRGPKLMGFVEVKNRYNRAHDAFPTVFLNALKLFSLHWAALAFGVRSFFVIAFTDGIYYIDAAEIFGLDAQVRGRTDRGDRNDIEPCIEIPIASLTKLRTGEEHPERS